MSNVPSRMPGNFKRTSAGDVTSQQEELVVVETTAVALQVYFEAGHWLYIEEPQAFSELVQSFASSTAESV